MAPSQRIIKDGLPKPLYGTVDSLTRVRNQMLGLPIRNTGNPQIPFGYKLSPTNPDYLVPVDSELALLLAAKNYLRNSSYGEVARWLTVESGRAISAEGLYKIMERRAPDDRITLPLHERQKV